MKTLILAFIILQITNVHGATGNIKGQIAEVKQTCHHVVIKNEGTKDFFVGKVTEGPIPRPGDSIQGKFSAGQNFVDNINQNERFEFYAKGSFATLGKANVKLKEFCD